MSHGCRVVPAGVVVVLSLLVPTASSAPAADPSGSLVQVSGRGGCVHVTARFGCARLRGATGALHSVSISPDGNYVYASDLFSILAFRRDRTTGTLTQLRGRDGCLVVDDPQVPVGSSEACALLEGVTAVTGAVAVGPEGRTAYAPVAIGSSRAESPTVVSFTRDPETGALRQSPDPPLCVKLRSNPTCLRLKQFWAVEAIVSRDARNLYLTSDGATWVFRRDPVTGALTQIPTPAGCLKTSGHRPFECTQAKAGGVDAESPDGRYLYAVPNLGQAAARQSRVTTIAAIRRQPGDGVLTPLAGKAGCVSSANSAGCARVSGLQGVESVVISADGRHLYAVAWLLKTSLERPDNSAVTAFRRSNPTGALTQLPGAAGCVSHSGRLGCAKGRALFGPLEDLTLSPDDRHLYVSQWGEGALAVFRRNRATGALTQLPGKAGCVSRSGTTASGAACTRARSLENPSMAHVSPDGRHVYAVSTGAIVAFTRVR